MKNIIFRLQCHIVPYIHHLVHILPLLIHTVPYVGPILLFDWVSQIRPDPNTTLYQVHTTNSHIHQILILFTFILFYLFTIFYLFIITIFILYPFLFIFYYMLKKDFWIYLITFHYHYFLFSFFVYVFRRWIWLSIHLSTGLDQCKKEH